MRLLYDYFRSSASYRVRIALNLKKLDYKKIPIHLINNGGENLAPEYKKLNPQGLVPTYIDDDAIGTRYTQSLSILEFLEERYPTPSLLPQNSSERAWVRSFAQAIACDMHPLNNLRVLKYLTNEFKVTEEQKNQWYKHWIAEGFVALEMLLNNYSQCGDFCHGNSPTMADICLVPQVYNAIRFQCDLTPYPKIMEIYKHCESLAAFIDAAPGDPQKA